MQPGELFRDVGNRLLVVVRVDGEAGGGLAYLRIDPFDPTYPEMIPAWSYNAEALHPTKTPAPAVNMADAPTLVQPLPIREPRG